MRGRMSATREELHDALLTLIAIPIRDALESDSQLMPEPPLRGRLQESIPSMARIFSSSLRPSEPRDTCICGRRDATGSPPSAALAFAQIFPSTRIRAPSARVANPRRSSAERCAVRACHRLDAARRSRHRSRAERRPAIASQESAIDARCCASKQAARSCAASSRIRRATTRPNGANGACLRASTA